MSPEAPAELHELYLATHRRLVAGVAALTGDIAEAEDCVQEAFARAVPRWRRIARYDDPEAWVRLVATNVARSGFRQRRRAAVRDRTGIVAVPPLSEDHVALLGALRTLPDDQREAIVLHHLVDLPVDEVAVRQGVAVGTVKARLSRGRRALATLLGVEDEESQDA